MSALLRTYPWGRIGLVMWTIDLLLAVITQDSTLIAIAAGFIAFSTLVVLIEDKT